MTYIFLAAFGALLVFAGLSYWENRHTTYTVERCPSCGGLGLDVTHTAAGSDGECVYCNYRETIQ